jgi:hypothetical protein
MAGASGLPVRENRSQASQFRRYLVHFRPRARAIERIFRRMISEAGIC